MYSECLFTGFFVLNIPAIYVNYQLLLISGSDDFSYSTCQSNRGVNRHTMGYMAVDYVVRCISCNVSAQIYKLCIPTGKPYRQLNKINSLPHSNTTDIIKSSVIAMHWQTCAVILVSHSRWNFVHLAASQPVYLSRRLIFVMLFTFWANLLVKQTLKILILCFNS